MSFEKTYIVSAQAKPLQKNIVRAFCMLLVVWFLGSPVLASADPSPTTPILYAATIYPYSTEGRQGFLYRVFEELARRVGAGQPILQVPLGRAIEEAKIKPVILIPTGRTAEREEFLNYGPVIYDDALVFVVRAGEKNLVTSFDQAKDLSVGTHVNSSTVKFLNDNGFVRVSTAVDNSNLLGMLLRKHIDVAYLARGVLKAAVNDAAFSRSDFEVALEVSKYPLYVAASKSVDPTVLDRWTKAFKTMKADGTYAKLIQGF